MEEQTPSKSNGQARGRRLVETAPVKPRAFLVGVEVFSEHSPWNAEDSLEELALLADTAGLEVVGSTYQKLSRPYPKHYIGPGKVQEIKDQRAELGYDLVVFDDELTGSQTRNLEADLDVRVIDRTQLILDIFGQHAQTREGRLQVELAQHEYLLPRLRGQWGHLPRQTATSSSSGAAGVRAEDQLFATLDPTTRQVVLPSGRTILLTDTVGFIQRLPTSLVAAFRATLEEIQEADLLLHVLDITHPNAEEQAQTVLETLADLEIDDKPILTVLNKVDQLGDVTQQQNRELARELGLPADYIPVSAERGWGLTALRQRIDEALAGQMVEVAVHLPFSRSDLVALWRQQGVIDQERYEPDGVHITGKLPIQLLSQFGAYRAEAIEGGSG